MDIRDFDYNKTIETKKLVYEGISADKMTALIFSLVFTSAGLYLSYLIFQSFVNNADSKITDYIMAFLLPLIMINSTLIWGYFLINRDRLREIPVKQDTEKAILLLVEAAKELNWRVDLISTNYISFQTNYKLSHERQTISLIIFPDKKIYFNSLHYINYIKPARFTSNYEDLVNKYLILEKQIS